MTNVGFMIDDNFITNLGELLKYNHLKIIKSIEKENDKKTIDLYNDFLITMFNQYFNVIQILQKRINFINTDVKLNNIFVKKSKNTNHTFNKLRDLGIMIDFEFLLSDMEKSYCYLNGIKIMSDQKKSLFKSKILSILKLNYLEKIRFGCTYNFEEKCNISIDKFDILTLVIDLYTILIKNINETSKLDKYFIHNLEIRPELFEKLKSIIKKNAFLHYTNRDVHIRRTLYNFCLLDK